MSALLRSGAALALAAVIQPAASCGTIEADMSYSSGKAIGTQYGVVTVDACCAACGSYPGCLAWTWGLAKAGDPTPTACYMKSEAPTSPAQKVAQPGIQSGTPGAPSAVAPPAAAPPAAVAPAAVVTTAAPPVTTLPVPTPPPTPVPTKPIPCAKTTNSSNGAHNCAESGCCEEAGMTCFMKDATWGQCTKKCKQGIHADDPVIPGKKKIFWSCSAVEKQDGEIRIRAFGMCGGKQANHKYTGPTTCMTGCTCTRHSEWSSTCMPDNGHGDACDDSSGKWRASEDDDSEDDEQTETVQDEDFYSDDDSTVMNVDDMDRLFSVRASASPATHKAMNNAKWIALSAVSLVAAGSVVLAFKRQRRVESQAYLEVDECLQEDDQSA